MWEKLKFIGSRAWEFLKPFIMILMSQAGPILADAAMKAVSLAAQSALGNSEKQSAAFAMITDELKQKGIEMTTSVINLAIEAAVVKMKASKT